MRAASGKTSLTTVVTTLPLPIRSYVRREGRMTSGQKRALYRWWSMYGVDATRSLDLNSLFPRPAPCIVEIGFGMGDALLAMARSRPHCNFLGIEVYRPGIGSLLRKLAALEMKNVRLICADAAMVFRSLLTLHSLEAVYILFPDPWPKKRHHKRRLVQDEFIQCLADKIRPGGRLHLATDDAGYAAHMLAVLERSPLLVNSAGAGRFSPPRTDRPQTKFETRGGRLGHHIWDLIYRRR